MPDYSSPHFATDRPLFVKREFAGQGRTWKVGQVVKWDEMKWPEHTVRNLFNNDFLHHNAELEEPVLLELRLIGDGLEGHNVEALHAIVDSINATVKSKSKTDKEFYSRKCAKSSVKPKQIGIIRGWRLVHGHLEA